MNQPYPRLIAILLTLSFFCLIWLYTLEFPVISNTIHGGRLAVGSMIVGLLVSAGMIWRFRERFTPWDRHRPDVTFIVVSSMFFMPLLGSWLNRGLGETEMQPFSFVAETPYFASGYGILQGEKVKPSGYHLHVLDKSVKRRFKYKTQQYFPITKPGEEILLPVRKGIFGARVMLLK